jgi:N-carbamoyl-L-amino-acid hydrolase
MTQHTFPVDESRLRRDIERNGEFGAVETEEGRGRTVRPGSPANEQAREYFVDRLADANLDVRVDPVGTIAGVWAPDGCDPDAAPVAAGSHLDSVPNGGIFDGPLGVYAALEAVRAMQDADATVERPIHVVSFTGEEGTRFADGVLGSSVAAGLLETETALSMTDGGETLREALTDIGFHGDEPVDAREWHAWLELHVEQGTRLEAAGARAGVVTAITGTTRMQVTIEGAAAHSGTTAMTDRTDALAAASELVLALESEARAAAEDNDGTAVATVGELTVEPGAVNVVPGRADLSIDIRDVDAEVIEQLVDHTHATLEGLEAERGVTVTVDRPYDVPPTDMSADCRDAFHAAADAVGVEAMDLHSGAGHDTMQTARATDAGLLFAPSEGGRSHSPLEWTSWADCATTTEILATALGDLAGATKP